MECRRWSRDPRPRRGAWAICLPFFAAGLLVAPARTVRAYRQGRRCRSLFVDRTPYEDLLAWTVAELRAHLGLPREGAAGFLQR